MTYSLKYFSVAFSTNNANLPLDQAELPESLFLYIIVLSDVLNSKQRLSRRLW
jgi:hypothetical protein